MQDDVVLFKDSVMLAEKLMMLGKTFDFVVAPTAVHGWSQKDYYAVYLFKKLVEHFDRFLGRGPRPVAARTHP
jgi:dipeptidyl aminopeptidase/acylaminoacyl peptidase